MSHLNEQSQESAPAEATDFEREFRLLPLGDDVAARLDRFECLLGTYLRAALNADGQHTTLRAEGLPVPRRDIVEAAVDTFRDPDEVAARTRWQLENPDLNQ